MFRWVKTFAYDPDRRSGGHIFSGAGIIVAQINELRYSWTSHN